MDVIDNYLDAVFAAYPATSQVLEAKAELRAMMEDIYTGALAAGRSHNEAVGQALSEFGQIDEVVTLMGLPPSGVAGEGVPLGLATNTSAAAMAPTATQGQRPPDATPATNAQGPNGAPAAPEGDWRTYRGTIHDSFPTSGPYAPNPTFSARRRAAR